MPIEYLDLAAGFALAALVGAGAAGQSSRADLEALDGTYASSGPEGWYGAYGTRAFQFDDGRWTLEFTLAVDPAMAVPVFRFRTGGPYTIGDESPVVERAYEATFREDAKFVTLLTDDPDLAGAFGRAACGLTPGIEADVSVDGCPAWRPVADCGEDHDLLSLDADGGLRFGVRPLDNDMCTADRRPAALLPAVVRR